MLTRHLSKLIAGCAAPTLLTLSIAIPACSVDEDFPLTEGVFPCTVDTQEADCLFGYECNATTRKCVKKVIGGVVPCVDMDKDGYGAGDERTECTFPEQDFDDNDPARYPGAPEICDGKDNDNDMQVDGQITCVSPGDCPTIGIPENTFFRCENGVCVLKPADTTIEGCNIEIACNGAAGYAELPAQCR
jgi:hypothetical protein